ncbi:CLUMA_CG018945, isoform A, partial [Clunio marinus]
MYQFVETRAASTSANALILLQNNRSKVGKSVLDFPLNRKRLKLLNEAKQFSERSTGIAYWMSRNQRVQDNWALLYAQELGLRSSLPIHVIFCLAESFLEATIRHFKFMIEGLKEVQNDCENLNINFHLLRGNAGDEVPKFVKDHNIGTLICDMSPLRIHRQWVEDIKKNISPDVPFVQIDAYNVVPVWVTSDKEEPAAYALRNKLMPKLKEFLTEFPPLIRHPHKAKSPAASIDWNRVISSLKVDRLVPEVTWIKPGYKAAVSMLDTFIKERLRNYAKLRNDPVQCHKAVSNLSPYFHFGQLSPQRAMIEVEKSREKSKENVESFFNEAVIWRELAENLCYYNKDYDNFNGAKDWAKATLRSHLKDKREYIYSLKEFEDGKTHDNMWNAAQLEMKVTGKMAGYMRMYWAKKILEWSETPEDAIKTTVYLNDRYSLDGRDPNGYLGIMWSIAGINDRPFTERNVIGKIRYMSYHACFQKFDGKAYVAKHCGGAVYKKINDKMNYQDKVKEIIERKNLDQDDDAFFIYNVNNVIKQQQMWVQQIPRVTPYFAVKCNNRKAVLSTMALLGNGFDCASKLEINKILKLGVQPDKIIFANPIKQISHIKFARKVKVNKMTFDCYEELLKIKEHHPKAEVILRIRFDAEKCLISYGRKFGCDPIKEAPDLILKCKYLKLNLIGIAFHAGSNCDDFKVFQKALAVIRKLFDYSMEIGIRMNFIDIGGGFVGDDLQLMEKYSDDINTGIDKYFNDDNYTIISEPGRYFVSSAFTLFCKVIAKKDRKDSMGHLTSIDYYINDGIFGSFLGKFLGKTLNNQMFEVFQSSKEHENVYKSTIWGQTCDIIDVVADRIYLPLLTV